MHFIRHCNFQDSTTKVTRNQISSRSFPASVNSCSALSSRTTKADPLPRPNGMVFSVVGQSGFADPRVPIAGVLAPITSNFLSAARSGNKSSNDSYLVTLSIPQRVFTTAERNLHSSFRHCRNCTRISLAIATYSLLESIIFPRRHCWLRHAIFHALSSPENTTEQMTFVTESVRAGSSSNNASNKKKKEQGCKNERKIDQSLWMETGVPIDWLY